VPDGHERAREEREAARLERERQRQRTAHLPAAADPGRDADLEPADLEPADLQPADLEPADLEPADLEPADLEPVAGPGRAAGAEPDFDDDDEFDDDLADDGSDEPPELASGTRRMSRLQAGSRARERRPAGRRRSAARSRAKTSRSPGSRRGHRWLGRIAALVALTLAGALLWFLIELFQPFGASPYGRVTVTIPAHDGSRAIGDLLAREGVIPSGLFFELRATLAGQRSSLRAGTYHLQLGMSYTALLTALTRIPPAPKTTQLTISEGRTRQYVAALLRSQHITGSYLAATRSSPLLDPQHYGAPRRTASLEGFLFPDTFTLITPIKISALVDDQLRDFSQRFATVNMSYARRHHLTPYEVLTIASLIEAEAASSGARPLVASVIYNRLADGMMLQLDSTARYATGNFTGPLTVSQLDSSSPYNTHTHFGLPPTPINSPGLAAIQAAAHPARSRYLFFFSKPCSNGTVFASTYSRFLALLRVDRRNHC
jgi:UPF0755 protein